MSKLIKKGKFALVVSLTISTIVWSIGLAAFTPTVFAADAGDLVQQEGSASVYYVGSDSKRYVFPNQAIFDTWYGSDAAVTVLSETDFFALSPGGNIVARAGRLVQFVSNDTPWLITDPTVYALSNDGAIQAIDSGETATALFGSDWETRIVPTPEILFSGYTAGNQLTASSSIPNGFLVSDGDTTYLIEGGGKRAVDATGFVANNYNESDKITVSDLSGYDDGNAVSGAESGLFSVDGGAAAEAPSTAGTGLTVALSSDTAAASTIIHGQAIANLASFTLTAASDGDVKVTNLKLKRTGVSADATLLAAYLYEGVNRLTDSASVSSTYMSWNNSAGIFTVLAGTTRTVTVKSNIATNTSGQTVGVAFNAASDITTDGATVNGSFPVSGNLMSIASATLAGVSFNTSTYPDSDGTPSPQDEFEIWKNTVSITTRAVDLEYITFRQIGSINTADVSNFVFYVDGTQVGSTVESLDSAGYVTFDLTGSPKRLNTGNRVMKVLANVVGGSTRTFSLSLRQSSDVSVIDSEYNANVLAEANSATFSARSSEGQTIATGTLIITKTTDSANGNVVNNGSQVTLAKFELKAAGESIKVESLDVAIAEDDADTDYALRNGALFADGVQVGSTASIPSDNDSPAYIRYTLGSSLIVNPGTPVTLEVVADVYDDAGADNDITAADTIRIDIKQGSANAQRMTSLGYFAVPANDVIGNVLTVAEGSLVLSKNQAYGNQTTVVPQSAFKLAEFTLNSGTTENVNLNTLLVDFAGVNAFDPSDDLTNLYVVYGSDTTSTKASVGDTANSWSINKVMNSNSSMAISIYADIAASADAVATGDTLTTKLKVSGTTANSGTAVSTNTDAVLTGQVVTSAGSGTLTVALDNGTPLAAQVVAGGTPDDGSLKIKLTAANEDVYVKTLLIRADTNANDAAIASLSLFAKEGSGSYVAIGSSQTLVTDGTKPGYAAWALTGENRVKVTKSGSSYILIKPTYVGSGQASVSDLKPKLFLADLEAEGAAVLTPSSSTPNLANDAGIIIQAGGSATYVETSSTIDGNILAADTTITTAGGETLAAGDIIFIDYTAANGTSDGDGNWDAAYEELMVVLSDGGADIVVDRGAFGTTARAYTDAAANDDIHILNTGISSANGIIGNAMTVLNTKLSLAVAADSPSGATTGSSGKVIFKFVATAANNASDPAENKVSLTSIDITTTESASTVTNLKLYPSAYDQNSTYATTCGALSTTKWRCILNTTGGSNEVVENTSTTYVARADVGYDGAGSVEVSIATLGSSHDADNNDVSWDDDASTTQAWVDQTTSSVQGGSQTTQAASGTKDTTDPVISAVLVTNVLTPNSIAAGDTIRITFNEVIDPSTISSTLYPGGATVTGIAGASTGGVIAATGAKTITVTDILTLTATSVAADTTFAGNTLSLDATGKILTVTVGTGTARAVDVTSHVGAGIATTVTDVSGEVLATTAPTVTGTY